MSDICPPIKCSQTSAPYRTNDPRTFAHTVLLKDMRKSVSQHTFLQISGGTCPEIKCSDTGGAAHTGRQTGKKIVKKSRENLHCKFYMYLVARKTKQFLLYFFATIVRRIKIIIKFDHRPDGQRSCCGTGYRQSVGWLVDIFCLDHSWTPMPNAVLLSLQIFKQTQKLTFSVNNFLSKSGPSVDSEEASCVRRLRHGRLYILAIVYRTR